MGGSAHGQDAQRREDLHGGPAHDAEGLGVAEGTGWRQERIVSDARPGQSFCALGGLSKGCARPKSISVSLPCARFSLSLSLSLSLSPKYVYPLDCSCRDADARTHECCLVRFEGS